MAYRITGERRYLDTIVNAYHFLQETQCFASGGYGPNECFIPPNGLAQTLKDQVNIRYHFETACGSWAAFKLVRYLMTFTGEAFYGDWVERLIYNGVGALLPLNKRGMIMCGSQYHLYGGQKSLWNAWSCCTGTLPIAVADYHNLIYFYDKNSLYINLFIPSKVVWKGPDGSDVTIIQETRFPEEETVNLHVRTQTSSHFYIKFRVPLWCKSGVGVKVNGKPFKTDIVPGSWAVIDREWNDNDKVTLQFDLSPRIEPLAGHISPVAILCGPVVMVATTDSHARAPIGIHTSRDLKNPYAWLKRSGHRLEYTVPIREGKLVFRPFYEIGYLEPYWMYFERPNGIIISSDEINFYDAANGKNWRSDGSIRYAHTPGSYFEAKFKGTAVVWEGLRGEDAGMAKVNIDGKEMAEVDQYGYNAHAGLVVFGNAILTHVPFVWSTSDLCEGEHTIRVTILPRKNPHSKGTKVNVKKLIAYP